MPTNSPLESVAPYTGVTVTLPVANTRANLLALLRAIDPYCPSTCRELNIQYDPTQAGAGGSILIGDSQVASGPPQRCAFNLQAGGSAHYGAGAESRQVYIANIWLVADTVDSLLVNVEVQN